VSRRFRQPRALAIEADAGGQPAWLRWHGRRERVTVRNAWRSEGAWWRGDAGRSYYSVLTSLRAMLVVFRDDADGRWYLDHVGD
jgi:hypothetical protein